MTNDDSEQDRPAGTAIARAGNRQIASTDDNHTPLLGRIADEGAKHAPPLEPKMVRLGPYELQKSDYEQLQDWAEILDVTVNDIINYYDALRRGAPTEYRDRIFCVKNGHVNSILLDLSFFSLLDLSFFDDLAESLLLFSLMHGGSGGVESAAPGNRFGKDWMSQWLAMYNEATLKEFSQLALVARAINSSNAQNVSQEATDQPSASERKLLKVSKFPQLKHLILNHDASEPASLGIYGVEIASSIELERIHLSGNRKDIAKYINDTKWHRRVRQISIHEHVVDRSAKANFEFSPERRLLTAIFPSTEASAFDDYDMTDAVSHDFSSFRSLRRLKYCGAEPLEPHDLEWITLPETLIDLDLDSLTNGDWDFSRFPTLEHLRITLHISDSEDRFVLDLSECRDLKTISISTNAREVPQWFFKRNIFVFTPEVQDTEVSWNGRRPFSWWDS